MNEKDIAVTSNPLNKLRIWLGPLFLVLGLSDLVMLASCVAEGSWYFSSIHMLNTACVFCIGRLAWAATDKDA